MIISVRQSTLIFLALLISFSSCKKESYTFGNLKTPANLALTTAITGTDATNPNGNGTGAVTIAATSANAITYKIDFGDGNIQVVPSGNINYKYTNPGTYDYTVTVNAIGTGGITSTISKKITVYVAFEIPKTIVQSLTGGTSKTWVTDNLAPGHVGVGPADAFSPIWYAADANQRAACLYDDEVTFTKDALNNILMLYNNKGQTFITAAATAAYGLSGGDNCYDLTTDGLIKLAFMGATSTSTPANSTRIQFVVPGDGIINFATGGKTYEILSITDASLHLRSIGSDGNAWFQILKNK